MSGVADLQPNPVFCSPQLNIMSFISELLQWFEVKKPDFVQPVQATDLTGVCRPGHQTDFSSRTLESVNIFFYISDVSGLLDCTSPINGSGNR